MSLGLVGRKVGMTRLFTDTGESVPVTVLDVSGNRVTQIKTEETDGYSAFRSRSDHGVQTVSTRRQPVTSQKPV
jgi:ribosomal protein L3